MKNITTKTLTALALALTALPSYAIYDPSYERPIEVASMTIIEATRNLENIEGLNITMNKSDGAPHITSIHMTYTRPMGDMLPAFERINKMFEVSEDNITIDACGSTTYAVHHLGTDENGNIGARTSMYLTDHRARRCKDYVPAIFELSMRQGYGFCGTMDATLQATGNPEAVYSIQQLNND